MKNEEKTIKSNVIYKGKILTLNCDDVLAANGKPVKREIIHHHGGVCVLAVVDGKIPLVKQYRYAYGENIFELPAGKLEKDESPELAGLRELEEEVGLRAKALVSMGAIYPSCGYTNEIIHLYVAKDVIKVERHLDDDECIDVFYFSLDEIMQKIMDGEIKDAKTICLVLKYYQSLQ